MSKYHKNFILFFVGAATIATSIAIVLLLNRLIEEERLSEYISDRSLNTTYVDFSEITPFDWEKLYIFPPYYSPAETLTTTASFDWFHYLTYHGIESNDTYTLFVFIRNNQVIYAVRGSILFENCFRDIGYTPNEARFEQNNNNRYMKWVGESK